MTITTYRPILIAFLKATGMSAPPGAAALKAFLESDEFLAHLTTALVEVEESKLNTDCLADSCGHDECPEPPGIGCGDAAALREGLLK